MDGFKWRNDKFNFHEELIKSYGKNRVKECIFEVNVDYPKELQKAHSELPFL